MCYSATAAANFFIEKSLKTKVPLTNMHLQNMLYFAHAAHFKQTERPLFSDPVFALLHGPVIGSVYRQLKHYDNQKITDIIYSLEPCKTASAFHLSLASHSLPEDDCDTIEYLNHVWEKLATVETWKLRKLSHSPGGAWYKTLENYGINPENEEEVKTRLPRNLTILDQVIKECGR